MLAINAEIAVERPNGGRRVFFGETHQTRIGKRHWQIGVTAHELAHGSVLIFELKIAAQETGLSKREKVIAIVPFAFEQEERLGDDRVTSENCRRRVVELLDGPRMLGIRRHEQCDERTGVDEPRLAHRP